MRLTSEELNNELETEREQLLTFERQIRDVESRLEHLYDVLEAGKLRINDLDLRIKGLIARRAKLERARLKVQNSLSDRKLDIEDMSLMQSYVADLKSLLGSAPILEQKAFLKSFVRSIEVSKSEVTVNYTLPMPISNTGRESVEVLAFGSSGRPCRSRTCDTLIKRYRPLIPPSTSE